MKPERTCDVTDVKLFIESERLKTFKKWPGKQTWSCTPQKLASAGFYYCPGPGSRDNVCCAFCQKELDGWEPDDDPLKEHRKHSLNCPFLSLEKPIEKLTVVQFLRLNMKMILLKAEKTIDKRRREFEEQGKTTREAIVEHVTTK